MVLGIDSFREKFKDYTEYYTIIGGTAGDILLTEADLPFRATKDIDMILIMEDNFPEFAAIFWEYIKGSAMNCTVVIDWKFAIALGAAAVGIVFAIKMDAKEVSIHAVDACKEYAVAVTGNC